MFPPILCPHFSKWLEDETVTFWSTRNMNYKLWYSHSIAIELTLSIYEVILVRDVTLAIAKNGGRTVNKFEYSLSGQM